MKTIDKDTLLSFIQSDPYWLEGTRLYDAIASLPFEERYTLQEAAAELYDRGLHDSVTTQRDFHPSEAIAKRVYEEGKKLIDAKYSIEDFKE